MKIFKSLIMIIMILIAMTLGLVYAETGITQEDIDEGLSFCKEYPVGLTLDGTVINFAEKDVPPVIINERALIPARALFEAMGGTVAWDEITQSVEIKFDDTTVKLVIGSEIAIVNGEEKSLEVPAMIIDPDGDYYGSTMIPVRFTAEQLGCGVAWEDATRSVLITASNMDIPIEDPITENPTEQPTENPTEEQIENPTEEQIENPTKEQTENPTEEQIENPTEEQTENPTEEQIENPTEEQTENPTEEQTENPTEEQTENPTEEQTENPTKEQTENPTEDNNTGNVNLGMIIDSAKNKLVVIDIGHGGKDCGTIGHEDQPDQIYEKDINLPIGIMLNEYLKSAGAMTYMIRETDVGYSLLERANIANDNNATIFVSIHNNSNDFPTPNGTEVLYYNKVNADGQREEELYGIDSKTLAQNVQDEMVSLLGTYDRGIKSSPRMALLNKTSMPAIIVEGAFLSNESDFQMIKQPDYINNYALAVAKAIIKSLNEAYK